MALAKNSPFVKAVTPKTKQWIGRNARQKIRSADSHEKNALSLDASTAISLFSPGVKGAYVNKSGCCFNGKWKDIGVRAGANIVEHVIDSIHHVSKAFCPNDSLGLVRAVFRHGGGGADASSAERDFRQWSESRLVKLLFQEFINAKKSIRRKQILSWVAATDVKRFWIKRMFGVSYGVISTAQRHALMWSPGGTAIRLSLSKKKYRPSARAAYLKRWLKVNVECDPSGKNKLRRLRFLRRHSGYKVYCVDNERDVPHLEPYHRSHFYRHPLQEGISDTKLHCGLCSICTRYGLMVFIALKAQAVELYSLLKSILPFDIDGWKKMYEEVRNYFTRGGMFQRSLKKSCPNKHCCLTFALSHPTMDEFKQECDHGE